MKITILGTGYVGLVSGACFASLGNNVLCIDIDSKKIENLKKGIIPIYEPGLKELLTENISFSTSIKEGLEHSSIIFIAVGTPTSENGSADLKYVFSAAEEIGKEANQNLFIINKSTVPVGTGFKVKEIIEKELSKREKTFKVNIISNPEFLKEGSAIKDFLEPDRIVLGAENKESFDIMNRIYEPFMKRQKRIIEMDILSSEMTKYAANSMLATKISFINEISRICELTGADVNKVREGIGSDKRIGYNFIYPGCGYGGSCFPKDVKALIYTAKEQGYNPKLLNAVEETNESQKKHLITKIKKRFSSLEGLTFGIWGLSFKPNTDDIRDAPSITIINELLLSGAKIKAYDPKAMDEAKKILNIEFCSNKYEAIQNVDALILITEWSEFRSPDFERISKEMKNKIIFDGRNQYNKENLKDFEYFQIGVERN